jgi:hypothetical protein
MSLVEEMGARLARSAYEEGDKADAAIQAAHTAVSAASEGVSETLQGSTLPERLAILQLYMAREAALDEARIMGQRIREATAAHLAAIGLNHLIREETPPPQAMIVSEGTPE